MAEMIGWKAWYGDGSTYTSATHKWVDMPVDNFQYWKKFYEAPHIPDTFAGLQVYFPTDDHVEIKNLIEADTRNMKIGQALSWADWSDLIDTINADTEIVTTMI